ncbi:MAG TPA: hypothetical protein DCZ92_06160, partial [Elusimicrobia bacterium]|nr:hypothetical protein [Elusimicrobiota bacterium]
GVLGANVIVSSIAANAVYNSAILDNAVTSAKIADGTIIAADIALSTISLDRLNQSGCASGQTAKWNGSAWACADDNDTNTTYLADGQSLQLTGNTFSALPSSVTLQGNLFNGSSQLVQLNGTGYLPALNGSLLTDLAPGNVANGTLGAGVIVSSVGANGVRPGSILAGAIVDADINSAAAIAISKLAGTGILGADVIASSIAVHAVYAAAIKDEAVSSAKIADGAIIAADIAMSTISLDRLNQSGCTSGQIAKWNGSAWACGEDTATGDISVSTITIAGNLIATPAATTVSAGATLIVTGAFMQVHNTNLGAVTLSGSPLLSNGTAGQVLVLQGDSDIRPVKVPSSGNIRLLGGVSFNLADHETLTLVYDGTYWTEISRSVN